MFLHKDFYLRASNDYDTWEKCMSALSAGVPETKFVHVCVCVKKHFLLTFSRQCYPLFLRRSSLVAVGTYSSAETLMRATQHSTPESSLPHSRSKGLFSC